MRVLNCQKKIKRLVLTLFVISVPHGLFATSSVDSIIEKIRVLENQRDPKCYATASRLEDFMFGTPLSHKARFEKNLLQKAWILQIWGRLSKVAIEKDLGSIPEEQISKELSKYLIVTKGIKGHWDISFPNQKIIRINKLDKRQYSSIAYSLRALLAVQQQSLLELDYDLVPLETKAMQSLMNHLDLLNLSVLKLADTSARISNADEISLRTISDIWDTLVRNNRSKKKKKDADTLPEKRAIPENADLTLTRKIVEQKIASYKSYNDLSNQLFYRNLQIYYARANLSKSSKKQKIFSDIFTQSMVQFSFDLYKESEKIALKNNHTTILESDIFELLQLFVPHIVDRFEDTHFFPKLSVSEQVVVESYDADSFRDNSAHWRFLKLALNSTNLNPRLQADPFALELISENIALFGVLSLKMAGVQSKKSGDKYLEAKHYALGLKQIAKKIGQNRQIVESTPTNNNTIISSTKRSRANSETNRFSDITKKIKLDFTHRSSDWLNRLQRSFLEKKKGVGVVFVPPAFGGGGIAAEDINNDGWIDLLVLGGAGNKLFMNLNGESFVDMSQRAGINWIREEDKLPGEPRQPLIADLNNDGLQDIIITYVDNTHRVYKNLGDFKFEDVSDISQLGGDNLVGGPATVADFDNDGLLDIYITYFGHYTRGVLPTLKRINDNALPNQLFKNMGDFKFKNVTFGSGVANTGWGQAVSHTDLDGDGLQDIIVGNDFGTNAYYRNNGDGSFKDIAASLRTNKASYSMSIGISDLNQDLIPDIYVSNIVVMNKDEKYISPNENSEMKFDSNKLANMRVMEANDLFLSNEVKNRLQDYSLSSIVDRGYSSTGWAWDADFFDYDNDGDMDLYVLNGMNEFNLYTSENPYFTDTSNTKRDVYIPVAEKESNVFFNNEDGRLINRSKNSGIDLLGNSRSAAYLDFDHDGDLDIALNNFQEDAVFYRNELTQEDQHWLKIKLHGDPQQRVNRDAIGARIIVHTMEGKTMWREISGSTGYMSVHPKIQHFGLGEYNIKNIEIIWPNGEHQIIEGLKRNQSYLIEQSKRSSIVTIH